MAWPNPNEYVEAIQHPQQAFADPDLRTAKVITNRLGLPRPISGNFATVFEVEAESCKWAVRCFLREVTNQQERYAAIAAHLKLHALPFMVHFEYLPDGIRVRGKWYPILKMDWTQANRLDTYIEQHLDSPQRLRKLGERWLALCRSLRQAEIAHGDLQHGNILVTDADEIKLIDYDGMIVPDVIGLPNNEIGHRHYQHPTRSNDKGITAGNFQNVDNFSGNVIGLSLLALSVDTSLWKRTQAGEENLLFRSGDYEAPDKSAVFNLLAHHGDNRVRAAAEMMLEAVRAPSYLAVPPFEHSPMETRLTQVKSALLSWLAAELPASVTIPAQTASEVTKASWVFDHVEQTQVDFSDDFVQHERDAAQAAFRQTPLRPLTALFPVYALAQFVWRYSSYPQVIEKANVGRLSRNLRQQVDEAKTRRKSLSLLIVEADRRYQQDVRTLEVTLADIRHELQLSRQQEAREAMRLERALHSTTHELLGQRLEPGRIAGIGAAQIEALAHSGIRTAADIIPANETAALHALNAIEHASPRSDWERLLAWREQHVSPITLEDVENIHTRYAQNRHSLEQQGEEAERQLRDVQAHSPDLEMVQSLHAELDAIEAEVAALQRQYLQAKHDLSRYESITLWRFLWRMMNASHG